MRTVLFVIAGATLAAAAGCDPAYSVTISNRSNSEKHITAYYPQAFKEHLSDSLITYDNTVKVADRRPEHYSKLQVLARDTVQRTYSLLLKPHTNVVIEGKSLAACPTFGQVFVINGKDTVHLRKKDKSFRRSWIIGGDWKYTIQDQ